MNILYIFFFVLSKMHLQIKLKRNKHVYVVFSKLYIEIEWVDFLQIEVLRVNPTSIDISSKKKFISLYLLKRQNSNASFK